MSWPERNWPPSRACVCDLVCRRRSGRLSFLVTCQRSTAELLLHLRAPRESRGLPISDSSARNAARDRPRCPASGARLTAAATTATLLVGGPAQSPVCVADLFLQRRGERAALARAQCAACAAPGHREYVCDIRGCMRTRHREHNKKLSPAARAQYPLWATRAG